MFDSRDVAAHERMARQNGVASLEQLADAGLERSAVHRMVRRRELAQLCPGVYMSTAYSAGPMQMMTAACLRNPRAAIAFTTAGRLWGLRGMKDDGIHVIVPHGCSPELPGLVVHRCRRVDPVDVAARRVDGIALTSPPRTAFDAAALIGADATESVIEQLLSEQRCTFDTLMRTMERLYHPRRPGALVTRAVLLGRPAWRGAARSELERRFRAAIEANGLPQPFVNHAVVLADGSRVEVDLAWPAWRVAGEVDHPFWHDGRAESRRDKRRDRKLGAVAWQSVRFTDWDIEHGMEEALADLRAILIARGWRP